MCIISIFSYLFDSCKITQHTSFELKHVDSSGYCHFFGSGPVSVELAAGHFQSESFASSQADLGYPSVARCSGPDYCNICKTVKICIYIYLMYFCIDTVFSLETTLPKPS